MQDQSILFRSRIWFAEHTCGLFAPEPGEFAKAGKTVVEAGRQAKKIDEMGTVY